MRRLLHEAAVETVQSLEILQTGERVRARPGVGGLAADPVAVLR